MEVCSATSKVWSNTTPMRTFLEGILSYVTCWTSPRSKRMVGIEVRRSSPSSDPPHRELHPTERFTAKYAGAAIMYVISKKLKKKYNISDERTALYEAAETWTNALEGQDFLGGSRPNLADLAVFGILRLIQYLKAVKDMVENTHIGEWYTRMETAVGESARVETQNAD